MIEQGVIPAIGGADVAVSAQFFVNGVLHSIPLLKEVTPLEECPENPCRMMLDVTIFTPAESLLRPWAVLLADGRGDLIEKRASGLVNNGREVAANFSRTVPVKWSEKYKCFTTMPQDNNLHLVGMDSLGRIVIWQAAIVSQKGKFFATLQQLGAHQATWNGAGVCFPTVDWPQLEDWLAKQFRDWQQNEDGVLPEPSLLPPSSDERGRATNRSVVLFWNLARGFGAIKTPSGIVARVHWTQAPKRDGGGLRYLKRDWLVEYIKLVPAQEIQAVHGDGRETSFKWEALGIILSATGEDSDNPLDRFRFNDEEYA